MGVASPLPNALRLPFRFDAAALCDEVAALGPDAWLPHFNTSYYEGDWSGLGLRTAGGAISIFANPNPSVPFADTAYLAACPRLRSALAAIGCEITSARVLRLGPGARVKEHRDYQIGLDFGEVRVHVPLQTEREAEFVLDGEPLSLGAGECWYVDVTKPHRLHNAGTAPRLHLVFDCVLDERLCGILERAVPPSDTARDIA